MGIRCCEVVADYSKVRRRQRWRAWFDRGQSELLAQRMD
jgi:hypothetical protein